MDARDVPQDRNDIGRVLFRFLDYYKALSGKYETAIVREEPSCESRVPTRACRTR